VHLFGQVVIGEVSAERDDRNPSYLASLTAQESRQFHSIQNRHVQIGDDQVRLVHHRLQVPLVTIARRDNGESFHPKQLGQRQAQVLIIFNDKNFVPTVRHNHSSRLLSICSGSARLTGGVKLICMLVTTRSLKTFSNVCASATAGALAEPRCKHLTYIYS